MNEQNLDYLKSGLKRFGFENVLNADLEKAIKDGLETFELKHQATHFRDKIDYTLNFRKSDHSDMYFFNNYKADLITGNEAYNRSQVFYNNNGKGFSAKEAYNLLSGRAVHKEFGMKDSDKTYHAWAKLDFSKPEKSGFEINRYHENYGYDIEKALDRFPIKELEDPALKKGIISSLEKGNSQMVTMQKDDQEARFYVEASPRGKTLNVRDELYNLVKNETVQKPELKESKAAKASKDIKKAKSEKETSQSKGVSV